VHTINNSENDVNAYEYILELYVTKNSSSSIRAIKNIQLIKEQYLKEKTKIEVIDIYENPEKLFENGIVSIPTLIRKKPLPEIRIIGDLSNEQEVIKLLII
jgi:circadian clock protein KaiB